MVEPLQRLADEREEGVRLRDALGVGLEGCAIERDPGLLRDPEQQGTPPRGDPASTGRGGEDRADDVAAPGPQRQRDERLGADPAPILRQRGIEGVVVLTRLGGDEPATGHGLRDEPAAPERIHLEATGDLVRHAGGGEGLETPGFAKAPHEHDVCSERPDLVDRRRGDLDGGRCSGEALGVPLHCLGLESRLVLALEERGAIERTAELLGDRVEHPLLGARERAPFVEPNTGGARGAVKRHDVHRLDAGEQLLDLVGPRVRLPDVVPSLQRDHPSEPDRIGRRAGRRRRDGPPVPLVARCSLDHLQRPHVVPVGDADDRQTGVQRFEEERDDGLGDLGRQSGGRETRAELLQRRRVPLEHLRALAGGALRIVCTPQAPLRRDPCGGEEREHQREHASPDQDREGGPVGDVAPAGDDVPAATAELERADGAGARPVDRREDLRAAETDASAKVLREVAKDAAEHAPPEPRTHEGDRPAVLLRRGVHRSEGLKPAPTGQEGNGAREGGTPGRLRLLDRLPPRRLAQQVEAEHGASRAGLGPDGDDGDVGRAAPRAAEDPGLGELRDPSSARCLELRALRSWHDLGKRQGVRRPDRSDRLRPGLKARGVDLALRIHEPGRGAKARQDAPDAVLEALDGRLCRPVVLGAPPLVGPGPQEPRDDAGRDRHERDERATDEHRRPDTVSHRHGDTTEVFGRPTCAVRA